MPKNDDKKIEIPSEEIDEDIAKDINYIDKMKREVKDVTNILTPERRLNAIWQGYEANRKIMPDNNPHQLIELFQSIGIKEKFNILSSLETIDKKLFDTGIKSGTNTDLVLFFTYLKYKDTDFFKTTEGEKQAAISFKPKCAANPEQIDILANLLLGYASATKTTLYSQFTDIPFDQFGGTVCAHAASKNDGAEYKKLFDEVFAGKERELNRMITNQMPYSQSVRA